MSFKERVRETVEHLNNHGALPGDHEKLAAARERRMHETGEHQTFKNEAMGALAVEGVLHPEHAQSIHHINVVDKSAPPAEIPVEVVH